MKKLLALAFASILGITTLSNSITIAHASEGSEPPIQNENQNLFETDLTQNQIDKMDKYVTLSQEGNRFIVLPEAYNELTHSEITSLELQLDKSNDLLSQVKETDTVNIIRNTNSVEIQDKTSDLAHAGLLQRSKYHDGKTAAKLYWWGVRIWLSRAAMIGLGGGIAIGGVWVPELIVSKILATVGILIGLSPGGIVFNSTPPINMYWGFEWQ